MRWARLLLAAIGALWLAAGLAFAFDDALIGQAQRAVIEFRASLKAIDTEVSVASVADEKLSEARAAVEDIRTKALSQAQTLQAPVDELNQQISQLGPPPADGATEAPAIADQRKMLGAKLNIVQGAKAQLELVAVEAEQLGGRVSTLQRELFFRRVFEAGRSVLNPLMWFDTGLGFGLLLQRLSTLYANWWAEVGPRANVAGLALVPLFFVFIGGLFLLLRNRLQRWFDPQLLASRVPDEIGRLWRVVRAVAAVFAVLIIIVLPISIGLEAADLMTPRFDLVYSAAVDVVFSSVIYWVLARRLAAPGQPGWRLIDIDDVAAGRLPVLVGLAAVVSISSQSLSTVASALFLPITYTIGQSAISAIVLFLLLTLILLNFRNQQGLPDRTPGRRVYFSWARRFTMLAWLAIATGVMALLFGYVALASFIATQTFETAVLVVVLFLLHHLSDAAVAASFDPASGFGSFLRRMTGLGERAIERLGIAFRTIVDLLLVVSGLPLLFLLWTVTWVDFRGMANTAFFGFKLGDITISPSTVLLVLGILIGGVALTNLIVRWLDGRILSQTRIDKGVQDSVRKGASYAGYLLAAGFALGAAGLDFSNLALVAGALGVGIGFGLQAIVNNFISGLILLAERPIRVGDWVVLDAGEGLVKRINVRATQIETFDNCTMFVPNLSLITGVVKNWTHGDTMGRFGISITVDYGSDAELVRATLMEVTKAHPKVLTFPEPVVFLHNFGMRGFDFEIKGAVADIFYAAYVATDIRFAILKAFAERSIRLADPLAIVQSQSLETVKRK
jgi:small-conductance mechanosensitive channel